MSTEPLVVERVYNAPVEQVWEALTDNQKMKEWYFPPESFKPEAGFEFSFSGGSEQRTYMHLCRITEVVPGSRIAYTWRYESCPGDSKVTFDLFPVGRQTRLRLTHEGLDSFPADNPDMAVSSFTAGWNHIIGSSLKDFLERP